MMTGDLRASAVCTGLIQDVLPYLRVMFETDIIVGMVDKIILNTLIACALKKRPRLKVLTQPVYVARLAECIRMFLI